MNRRAFLSGLGALATAPSFAWAQPASRVYRIGYLGSEPVLAPTNPVQEVFWARLRELGYAEGRNLVVERRSTEGRNERYRALARELVNLKVDLIIAAGAPAAVAAKEATSTIPIVTVIVSDPVGARLIASLARPGGNVTGMSSAATDIPAKELELLKEVLPGLSRVAVLSNPTAPMHATFLKELEVAARTLRVRLQPIEVRTPKDIESAFAAITKERAEALILVDDPLMYQQRRRIADLAVRHRLPTVSFQRLYPEAGALMSYGASFADLFRRAATYVDKILKGAKPADLPVEQPTKFELVINLKTAKAFGLTIPQSLLQRADEVIQ
ncbi:MAG TPA: ABC transporter substrate-binding protein [Methylomirabilota bacterium]|nr:ABC transporter substrate-binding protein [Methylomirabilota bacterium]